MTQKTGLVPALEPERYELHSPISRLFETGRRDFFKFLGAGIFVACAAAKTSALQESGRSRRGEDNLPREIDAWLHVGEKGEITAFTGKVEVGQNIRTSLSQAVAEELCVSVESIHLVMGDTQLVPYDMGTFGSRTTPTMNLQLRRVSAAARDELLALAAREWSMDVSQLRAADGRILGPKSGQSIGYSDLVKGQQITQLLPAVDPLIPASEWKVVGQPVPKVDGFDFVTGKHRYPADQSLPNMLYGKVVRPPSFGATLLSADTRNAGEINGITVVRDGDFLAVAAPTSVLAEQAAASIHAQWKTEPQISNKELFDYLKKTASHEDDSVYQIGNVDPVFSSSAHRLSSTFTVQYIAHAPLEPRAALAEWRGDQLTVWTGTQRPFGVRSELATAFHMPEEKVRVIMPDTGSGYGGKHTGDAALEAARLARAVKRPVKVVWTREEEFTWAYFRPAGVMEVTSAVDDSGKLIAWEFHNYNSGSAGIRTYYEVPHQRIQFHPVESPLRQGSYRALAATANHFAREVHMDEIAHSIGLDPLEFRLKNLKDARLRAVFAEGGKEFGWDKPLAKNRAFGVGGGFEKLGYMATFAEVSLNPATRELKIDRVLTAFDCGAIVNPDGLRNQLIGANIMGLGGALFEAIQFENGRIVTNVFSKYRVPRFRDVPAMDTLLIDRKDQPSAGAGEAPLLGIAPAIANAVFALTGIAPHSLPIAPLLASRGYKIS